MSDAIVSYVAIGLSVATTILAVINHKRVRSTCCGKTADISFDVENTTPPSKDTLKVPIPAS